MSPRGRLAAHAAIATAATSSALSSVFADGGWVSPTLGAVLVVFLGAEVASRLAGRLLFGWFWRLAGGALALLVYACALDAGTQSWAGFVPTPAAVGQLHELLSEAFHDIRTLAAPVPSHTGMVLLTLLGVGAVAIVADQLTVKAPLVGLPLLALYSVPEWLSPHGTGPLPFLLGAAAYLALLVREGRERTVRWGRAIGTTADRRPAETTIAGAMGAAGRRIGVLAVGVALVIPPLVPGLDQPHLFGLANGIGSGHGKGPVVTYNPITRIAGDLNRGAVEPLLTYRTSDGKGTYLEFSTLDRFDLGGWSQSDLTGAGRATEAMTPPETPAGSGTERLHVDVDDHLDIQWLPLPPDTTQVSNLSDQWLYDARSRTVFSPHSNTRGISYDAVAAVPRPSDATLRAIPMLDQSAAPSQLSNYLALPAGVSARVVAEAHTLTDRYSSPYLKAWALQYWFTYTGGFTYDTHSPRGNSVDALENFVFDSKRGFCEQFATAMAAMARMVGIPARVAIGFTPGTKHGNEYVVTTDDAHAWPELYFQGAGWLRFEPTPRGTGGATAPSYAKGAPVVPPPNKGGSNSPGTSNNSTTTPGGTGNKSGQLPHNIAIDPNTGTLRPLHLVPPHHPLSGRALAGIAIGLAIVAAAVALPIGARLRRRRTFAGARDDRTLIRVSWRDVMVLAEDLGLRGRSSDSPRGAARRLAREAAFDGVAEAAAVRLAHAEERARYAAAVQVPVGMDSDVRVVRAALFASAGRWRRIRAVVFPPSAVHAVFEAVGGTTDSVFAGVERIIDAVRARRPRRGTA